MTINNQLTELKQYLDRCEMEYNTEINFSTKQRLKERFESIRYKYLLELSKSYTNTNNSYYIGSSDYGVYPNIQYSACIGSASSIGLSWGSAGLVTGNY